MRFERRKDIVRAINVQGITRKNRFGPKRWDLDVRMLRCVRDNDRKGSRGEIQINNVTV